MTLTYFWKIGWTEPITLFRHDKNKPFLSIDCPPCFYIPTQETSRALFRIKDICESFVCFKYLFIETLWKETTHGEFYYKSQGILVIFVRHPLILSKPKQLIRAKYKLTVIKSIINLIIFPNSLVVDGIPFGMS